MKLFGPIMLLCGGLGLCGLAWLSQFGPTDHNIGRSIVTGVARQALTILGVVLAIAGLTWLAMRAVARRDRK